jgi:hypothetical protein
LICTVNSCCSPQAVCLPVSWTNFCPTGNTILHIQRVASIEKQTEVFLRRQFLSKPWLIAGFTTFFSIGMHTAPFKLLLVSLRPSYGSTMSSTDAYHLRHFPCQGHSQIYLTVVNHKMWTVNSW